MEKTHKATMMLPKGGKNYWTTIMYGEAKFDYTILEGEIIVAAYAKFEDGVQVIGGVKKSQGVSDPNYKFFIVLDADGKVYPNWPIDVSDHEDFQGSGFIFILNNDEDVEYHLDVKEKTE